MEIEKNYQTLVFKITKEFTAAQKRAFVSVNTEILHSYWSIGKYIADYQLKGQVKSEYGSHLYQKLAHDLSLQLGKGFSRSGLYLMRQFYTNYPIVQAVSGQLTWSHYIILLGISDPLARQFYEQQSQNEHWSSRELKRQVQSGLFMRLAMSKDKNGVLQLAQQGQIIEHAKDLIKDPYVLNFWAFPKMNI